MYYFLICDLINQGIRLHKLIKTFENLLFMSTIIYQTHSTQIV